jgi:hypothetical protein
MARPTIERLGIRHHGPGSARSVTRALHDLRPDAVLVEFPADAGALIRWVADGLVPPVAVLGYAVDAPQVSAFLPLAEFSPEWQAFTWALEHDVPVSAIDLPLKNALAPDPRPSLPAARAPARPVDPIAELAAAAGDPEPERWWEDVIEHRGDGVPAFDAVAEAMTVLRAHELEADFDLLEARREAHMRRAIRAAAKEGFERIVVVCGAWHVPALDVDRHPAAADVAMLRGLPRVNVSLSWIPWTHQRLAAATGYRAGVESPGWYAHVHAHPGTDGVARFLVTAANELRADGFAASPDHLIAATRLTTTLAAMRGRPRPGLGEVLDAAEAVFTDGHRGTGADLVRRRLVVGDAIGYVPERAPQVPLARDVAAQQRRLRLTVTATVKTVELDLRRPNGLARSRLLHRLSALGVRWGQLVEGRGTSGTFRETWRISWQPEESVRLVELAHYGTTLRAATTARCVERAAATSAPRELVAVLEVALLADLPDVVGPCVTELSARAAHDPDLGSLMDTLRPLAGTLRYGDVRRTDVASLHSVFDGLVTRVLAGLSFAPADDDAADVMADRLSSTQAALALLDHPARHDRWPALLGTAAEAGGHGLVCGRASRLLHDSGHWNADRLGRRLSRALSAGTPATEGAAFVEGFVAGSGTVLVHDTELLSIVDAWLSSLPGDKFDDVVPLLRRTFGGFDPAERRQLGWWLSDPSSSVAIETDDEFDPERLAAAAAVTGLMLGLDRGAADG